jgi:predicted nucleic acid-binding protein
MKSVFIDSNIIIRLVVKDLEPQFLKAKKLMREVEQEKKQGVVSILVINEIIWILEHYYLLKRSDYIPILQALLSLKNLKIYETKKDDIFEILTKMERKNIDFTDFYLILIAKGYEIASFDKDISRLRN